RALGRGGARSGEIGEQQRDVLMAFGRGMANWARAVAVAAALLPAFGCSMFRSDASSAPADPYAAERPNTASVGVTMPDLKDFHHPWDVTTYTMRVTQFGIMPPLNGGVAFVGDSLTDWVRWNEMFPQARVRNFGIAGDTTVGLQHRVSQVV